MTVTNEGRKIGENKTEKEKQGVRHI